MGQPLEPETDLQPGDKVLLLGIPDAAAVRDIAARLTSGILVVLGGEEEVRAARREFRDLENVMCVPASADGIPWQDGYFTRVIDAGAAWPDPNRLQLEIKRVLKPRV